LDFDEFGFAEGPAVLELLTAATPATPPDLEVVVPDRNRFFNDP